MPDEAMSLSDYRYFVCRLLLCRSPPFAVRKAAFCVALCGILFAVSWGAASRGASIPSAGSRRWLAAG